MRKFTFNKLVRDVIPSRMLEQGERVEVRTLSKQEHRLELIKKLGEEATELAESEGSSLEEIADLQEIIDCLAVNLGLTKAQIDDSQARKREKYGSFDNGQFITTVEVPEDSDWISHLVANPERYPETI